MVKDVCYIIKRILIGVGIVLVLSFLKGNFILNAFAQTYGFQSYELCSIGYGCSSGNSLPISQSYGNVAYSRTSNVSLLNSHTYSFSYYGVLVGKNISIDSGYPLIYVSNSGNNYQRAYPDRYESLYVTYLGSDRYSVSWSFDMDIVGNFNEVDVTYYFTSNFQNTSTSVSLLQSEIDVTDITSSGSSPSQDIINNNNQNTQNIINNQQNNTQNIINNNNSNTQDIMDNQNQNTQQITDSINNNMQSCTTTKTKNKLDYSSHLLSSNYGLSFSYNSSTGYLSVSGTSSDITSDTRIFFTDFIPISELGLSTNSGYSFSKTVASSDYRVCLGLYNSNQSNTPNSTLCIQKNGTSNGISFGSTINYQYYRLFILSLNNNTSVNDSFGLQFESGNSVSTFVPPTETTCTSALTDDSGVNNSDIQDLFDDINDDSNSPVSDLLTLPITLLQAYINGFDSTCSPISLGTLYGTNLVLPCIDIPDYIGNSLWNMIDAMFCLFMIYNIAMMCVSIYESFTSLDDSMQLLYSPQHTGHSRVSRNEANY